jgi:P27 family predicted phage terminase small subunit
VRRQKKFLGRIGKMPRGAPRKPSHLKVVQGTFRPDRTPEHEPKPAPVMDLSPPAEVLGHARKIWTRLAPLLSRLGLLTEADSEQFAALCNAWGRYQLARRRLKVVLKTTKVKGASNTLAKRLALIRTAEVSVERAEFAFRTLAVEFGLSPASRSRLNVQVPGSDHDEFQEFLRRTPQARTRR